MAKHELNLPFFTVNFSYPLPAKELILVTGGRSPQIAWLKQMAQNRPLWCIDHGLDCCYEANLLPQRLIGDGDSAQSQCWRWAEDHLVEIAKFPPEKDYTDTQLALDMAAKEDAFVILTGAFGGRFDHGFSTAFTFAHSTLKGVAADEREAFIFLKAGEAVNIDFRKPPKALSLLSFSETTTGVDINNVKWPLQNKDLQQGFPYSVSNEVTKNPVHITIRDGILGIYLCWDFI